MFVDASAIVAIIAREPQAETLTARLEEAPVRYTSAVAVLETVMALRRLGAGSVAQAEQLVRHLLEHADIEEVPITTRESAAAIAAYARYGKGQGHPAQLNLGDCFAYACARTRNVPLLFVGNDFSQTDIAAALA
ncbi:VapC toxin family PIN domain ribonuclease [Methylorubrum extorquens]|uniref:type II toxin-antitoxin system VapC family toxin n=1 Tax=Methylorubrum extorquens TaxID=408 RepID=UPI0009729296|nr:type II toxin-antitoxin system VapC family toxin [Methylorubrum extorquens]APX84526.1 VapC toxin family PIN domain ribonuclease [Methylorubrum extorquens]